MIYLYDGTYKGLLSVVFESYRLKTPATNIVPDFEWQKTFFDQPLVVACNQEHADRVSKGVKNKTSAKAVRMLYRCYLSEKAGVEMLIYNFIRKAMASKTNIETNYLDSDVLELQQINKMMGREVHRMHAFIRFQRTKDDLYYSVVEPDFDVLPLITDHFIKRYPAQRWLIYDAQRHYGKYWNESTCETVTFTENHHRQLRQIPSNVLQEEEADYQHAWKLYFKSTNIPERKNRKLHLQHVPRRYWKYLVEK